MMHNSEPKINIGGGKLIVAQSHADGEIQPE